MATRLVGRTSRRPCARRPGWPTSMPATALPPGHKSDQSLAAQGDMPLAPDDHVIVDYNSQMTPGLGDALGDLDVRAARLGISARMVVHQDQSSGAKIQTAPNNLARVDRRFVDRALAREVVVDQPISAV